ncbi:hypothetical protein K502DRAFT_216138 [Neoconidiobolus thromboides FSU 785]|nr:hypothetical protein K502DRAFT_216138 [Neoconidiobolus thromboides FSU 785]
MYQSNHGFIGSLNSPIVIQAMILESLPNNEEPELKQIVPSTGFDRLREAGFSEQDIHQLRQQFQMAHNIDGTTNDPEEQDRNRRLEEAWIDNTNQTLPDGIAIGCYYQMVQGMVLGFFGSFIAVVFISDKMFTRYQQLGLAFGFLINIGFGCILAIQ